MDSAIRSKAVALRHKGKTYAEINQALGLSISKSTLSYWCKGIVLSPALAGRIASLEKKNLARGRVIVLANKAKARDVRKKDADKKYEPALRLFAANDNTKKVALAILYLAEGSKTDRASVMFGNSNPSTVKLFVSLLRACFPIQESKFRATVQCRADQDTEELQKFWSKVTGIPKTQFYKAHIDARSVGKPTKKLGYKGVCRIDYFSSNIDFELKHLALQIENIKIN